ncbi:hypothetical protein GCM10028807_17460 [Spirosoma daeguense]
MSLQVRINGQVADMTPNTSINLELTNPYLVYGDILSDKATIPALPITPRNQQIMGFPDLLQSDAIGMRYQCEKYYNGQLLQAGVAILTEAAQNFALTVVQPLGELFGDDQTITLPAQPLGAVALPGVLTPVVQQANRNVLAFPMLVNPDFYGSNGATISYSGYVNEYGAGAYTTTGPLVPMVFLKELFYRITEKTGVRFFGHFLEHDIFGQLLVYNTRALDRNAGPGQTVVELQHHLPEMTIPVLLLELRKLFNLAMNINTVNKTVRLDFMDNYQKKAASKDWSAKAVKEYKKQPETARRLQLGSTPDGNDGLTKDKPELLNDYLTPALESDTGISPLVSQFSTLLIDPLTGLATAKQPGTTELFSQLTAKFTPRLLFWNGLQNGKPTATAKWNGYSLFWNGADGLANVFWKQTEIARQRQFYVERLMNIKEVDLATLDFSEKVYINGVDYWLAKLIISLPVTAPATALLVRA